jgi:4-hydroxy-2-oxoheptanedioate aldolase
MERRMAGRLKELLTQGGIVRVFGVGQLCDPKLIEIVGWHGGYDAVWLDQEHAGLTISQIEHATRAARASGLDSFVRLTATDYATVMRPLEAGAGGVMAAMIRTVRQAEDVVQWAKFHPAGVRGINGTGVDGRYGTTPLLDYLQERNERIFVAIQIEHIDAVENVEQIAAIPGVDVLFIGPADLSQSLGIPGQIEHPRMWQAIERVAAAAQMHKTHWAILPRDRGFAERCVALGCRMLSLGIDVWALQKGLKATQADFAGYFGP